MTAIHPEAQSISQAVSTDAQRDALTTPGQFLAPPQSLLDEIGDALGASEVAEPAWLAARRRDAATSFAGSGFPTPKHEDWKYTSTAPIAEAAFATLRDASVTSVDATAGELAPFVIDRAWPTAVFVNGRFDAARSSLGGLPAGVRVLPLAQALAAESDLLERSLGRVGDVAEQPFAALNTALFADGVAILVGKEMVSEVPVHVLWVTDANAARYATHPRTLIVAERHSRLTVLESFCGTPGGAALSSWQAKLMVMSSWAIKNPAHLPASRVGKSLVR